MSRKRSRQNTPAAEPLLSTARFWKWLYIASLLLGSLLLSQTLPRLTDGDDAMYHYEAGLRSWPDILTRSVVPPEVPAFVFRRYRPMTSWLFPKIFWEIGPSPVVFKGMLWVLFWFSTLVFSWAMVRALSLGHKFAPGTTWALACVIWWSGPSMILASLVLPFVLGLTAFYFAVGLSCDLGTGRQRWLRGLAVVLLAFIGFQTYEANWFQFLWLGLWIGILKYLGAEKNRAIKPWIPFVLVAIYLFAFRTLIPEPGRMQGANSDGFIHSFDPLALFSGFMYFLLATLNGISAPLHELALLRAPGMDVTPASVPWAFVLTAIALYLAWRSDGAPKSGVEKTRWKWATLSLLVLSVPLSAPFWTIMNFRFMYFPKWVGNIFSVWFVTKVARGKRIQAVPVLLLIVANAGSAVQYLTNWNWTELNLADSMGFYKDAMSRPEFQSCTTEQPCCVTMHSRRWARNEWTLSWLSGAPKHPAFYPDDWPDAPCVRHIKYD